jgi:hypothetical protein
MIWTAAEHQNERENEEADNGNDLDRRKQELGLAIYVDGEDIQEDDQRDDEGDPCCWLVFRMLDWDIPCRDESTHRDVSCSRPVVDDNCRGIDLETDDDGVKVPILYRGLSAFRDTPPAQ